MGDIQTAQAPPTEQSEFGRGLVTCLVAFLDHKARLFEWLKLYENMRGKMESKDPDLFTDERAVELWANGASDHLFELEIPPRLTGTPLAHAITAFRDKWLAIGHGFGAVKPETINGAVRALEECERLALAVGAEMDKVLGLPDAEVGQWT